MWPVWLSLVLCSAGQLLPYPAKMAWSRRTPERPNCARVRDSATVVLEFTNACPLLATEDPYAAASIFSQAGWKVEYESARDGDQPRACLAGPFADRAGTPKRSLRRPAWPRHRFLIHVSRTR